MQHAFVTGAAGFIGSNLVDRLLACLRIDGRDQVLQAEVDREEEAPGRRLDGVIDADLAGRQDDLANLTAYGQIPTDATCGRQ